MIAAGGLALAIGTVGRWLSYAGIMGALGGVAAAALATRALPTQIAASAATRTLRLAAAASLLVLVALPARLAEQAAAFADREDPWLASARAVLSSGWGAAFKLQAAAGLALAAAAWFAHASRAYRPARGALVFALAALMSVALVRTGHAVEFPRGAAAGVVVQALHILGGGLWLGTLAALAAALPRRGIGGGDMRAYAPAFHRLAPLALTGAALVLAGGVTLSWSGVRTLDALWTTAYGQLVVVKVGLVTVIFALGGYHWRRAVPALAGDATGSRFRATLAAEVAAALVVLGVTAALSVTAAPGLE